MACEIISGLYRGFLMQKRISLIAVLQFMALIPLAIRHLHQNAGLHPPKVTGLI
jgi:hypothetical protein